MPVWEAFHGRTETTCVYWTQIGNSRQNNIKILWKSYLVYWFVVIGTFEGTLTMVGRDSSGCIMKTPPQHVWRLTKCISLCSLHCLQLHRQNLLPAAGWSCFPNLGEGLLKNAWISASPFLDIWIFLNFCISWTFSFLPRGKVSIQRKCYTSQC